MHIPALAFWQYKAGKLAALVVVLCVIGGAWAYHQHSSSTAINSASNKTNAPGPAAHTPQNGLLPVTTSSNAPITSADPSGNNVSGQSLQSQPNSTPNTASPQETAPEPSPVEISPPVSTPVEPTPTPVAPHCAPCGGIRTESVSESMYACPNYCVE